MIRISRFFLPFLCCLTAPVLAGTQTRWEVVPDSTAIVWNVREGDSHRDHIEMSGLADFRRPALRCRRRRRFPVRTQYRVADAAHHPEQYARFADAAFRVGRSPDALGQ